MASGVLGPAPAHRPEPQAAPSRAARQPRALFQPRAFRLGHRRMTALRFDSYSGTANGSKRCFRGGTMNVARMATSRYGKQSRPPRRCRHRDSGRSSPGRSPPRLPCPPTPRRNRPRSSSQRGRHIDRLDGLRSMREEPPEVLVPREGRLRRVPDPTGFLGFVLQLVDDPPVRRRFHPVNDRLTPPKSICEGVTLPNRPKPKP